MDEKYFVENLDRAISEGWIIAYYQPLIRAANGYISDEEALARWVDPERGTFTASEFIPVLEKVKLTYKLDLYMVEHVLKKMKDQGEHGFHIVPESVNLARSDFDRCDMVTEIAKRIDAAGIPREKFAVELSEKVVSQDLDYMKSQVERFKAKGIKVWLDDYGSGYSTLFILSRIRFDLLKIDKVFVDQIESSDNGRIILTELVKTAIALGMDTSARGVESREQVRFLKEIGCIKMQGYYYLRPLSVFELIERNKAGVQFGFEDPKETPYYEALGKVNLYDFDISGDEEETLNRYFDTMPMVIFELDEKKARFVRCNRSYRRFVEETFPESRSTYEIDIDSIKPGIGYYSFNAVRKCAADGKRAIIDDRTKDGKSIQLLIRRISVNPVTGVTAVAIVVLSVSDTASSEGLTYNYIARALSEDYVNLYFVDMDTDSFAEYAADGESRDIVFKKYGSNFFKLERDEFDLDIYSKDFKKTREAFAKENIEKQLEKTGVFSFITRFVIDKEPTYVNIKVVRIKGDGNKILVGVVNVDNQIKEKEIVDKAREERTIYSRVGALTGDYIYIYTVDPVTDHYVKFNPSRVISDMAIANEGDDFFRDVIDGAPNGIYEEDLDYFLSCFNRDNVYRQIEKKGLFENAHRLKIGGEPRFVVMKATTVVEDDEEKLIVGILDVDERVKNEKKYQERIAAAQNKANLDELTGVKNKHAYAETEKEFNERIAAGEISEFAVVVFDLNGLKNINDTLGHQAGDEFIKEGCSIICKFFKHSPVFRIGGDEFVAIAKGCDYVKIDSIMTEFKKHNIKNKLKHRVVVAAGMSLYNADGSLAPVFERADEEMYRNKKELKNM